MVVVGEPFPFASVQLQISALLFACAPMAVLNQLQTPWGRIKGFESSLRFVVMLGTYGHIAFVFAGF